MREQKSLGLGLGVIYKLITNLFSKPMTVRFPAESIPIPKASSFQPLISLIRLSILLFNSSKCLGWRVWLSPLKGGESFYFSSIFGV